ncbi:MAG: DNA starvation/stationary phase protection protein [Bacteroidetes bacterium GWF2_33_38]|nr:MAG: DNA starvation/stationary phase protection protein [Bacteroidetes bacterium GWF2_33_38]OFY75711.1 MAG: DNA starvation/stationary phase protection protein [Bacteroidetes bacterium RIFOXYA12_FULL_33_9]
MKTNIGIPYQDLEEVATILNKLLADEYVLKTKIQNAHWNITGVSSFELHKFFESQYETIDHSIDEIAERIRSLGHFAIGSMRDFLAVTNMVEEKHDFANPAQIIQSLLNDHEIIIRVIRNEIIPIAEKYKDLGTADFVTSLMQKHEKMAWMLRAFIS